MNYTRRGEVSERLKEHAWKACVGETQPWVRIPPSPPSSLPNWLLRRIERKNARILAEIRVFGTEPDCRESAFLVIRLNQAEFSPGCGPAVRFHLPSGERRGVRNQLDRGPVWSNGVNAYTRPQWENRLDFNMRFAQFLTPRMGLHFLGKCGSVSAA